MSIGDVTYAGGDPSDPSNQPASTAPQGEIIDINDPRLTSETITDNPEGDAYAQQPPLPDGKWRAKASQVDIKDDKGQLQRFSAFSRAKMQGGKPFLATNVAFSVLDSTGKFDGIKLTEYWVKTLVEDRTGTSQVATLLRKLGVPVPTATTQGQLMELFLGKLAGEPELVIETSWSAECQACQEKAKHEGARAPKPVLRGMHRFPQVKGHPDPIVACSTCKAQLRAQPRIVAFYGVETPHNP